MLFLTLIEKRFVSLTWNIKKNRSSNCKVASAIILLLLFIAGNVSIALIHQLIHEHTNVEHTVEMEKDPCHNGIYHAGNDNGCRHGAHLINIEKCDLCDFTFQKEQVLQAISYLQLVPSYFYINNQAVIVNDQGVSIQLPARAPPFSSPLSV